MDKKTYRMLELLDQQIQICTQCNLYENGRAKPYWTEDSKYMLLLEGPGREEVENNEVVCGKAGRLFWDLIAEYQYTKSMFLIINSVNCRVSRNGKPSEYHRDCCREWIRKYFKVFKPEKLVLFGNYATHTVLGEWGISKLNGKITTETIYDIDVDVLRCFHPASMIYSSDKKERIKESIDELTKR